MLISCLCPTYNRPALLAESLACFEAQTWPDRELVILDDAGQYDPQAGDRWRLLSLAARYPALGAKRNALAGLASPRAEVLAVWDDDDLYAPWHLAALAEVFGGGAPWVKPAAVWGLGTEGDFCIRPAGGLVHPGCAFRRDLFESLGGYRGDFSNGEDCELAGRLVLRGIWPASPTGPPSVHHRWYAPSSHLARATHTAYGDRASEPIRRIHGRLTPRRPQGWPPRFTG